MTRTEQPTEELQASENNRGLKRISRRRVLRVHEYAIVGICLVLFIVLSILSNPFLSKANLLNILDQNASAGVMAFGETIVIISGNFDLSVGSTYSLAGVIGLLLVPVVGPVAATIMAVFCGTVVGAVNGGFVVFGRVHSFIATLATQYMIYGLALVVSGGVILVTFDPGFLVLGQNNGLGVKYAIWVMVAVGVVTGVLLARSVFGRHVYAVGGNRDSN